MDDWGPIVLAVLSSTVIASAVTGLITWRVQSRTLAHSRLIETSRLIVELGALGNARPPDGSTTRVIAVSEQLAAISTLAAIGRSYRPLRESAKSYLDGHVLTFASDEPMRKAIHDLSARERATFD